MNPGGNMGIGALIIANATGEVINEHSSYVPKHRDNSNNVAEYMGFIWLMEELTKLIETLRKSDDSYAPKVVIYGDSRLVVMQMLGEWKIKQGRYVKYANDAWAKLANLKGLCQNIHIDWIPRDKNDRADELSKGQLKKNNVQFRIQPEN